MGISSIFLNTASIYAQNSKPKIEKIGHNTIAVNDSIQYIDIIGTVSDESGLLPGVNISEKGQNNKVTTDIDGKFLIKVPVENFNKNVYLIFEYTGLGQKEIKISANSKKLNIKMGIKPSEEELKRSIYELGAFTIVKKQDLEYVKPIKRPNLFKRFINLFKQKKTATNS